MKKFLTAIIAVVLLFSFVACGGNATEQTTKNEADNGKTMTLDFNFGQRTGTYWGDLNDQGLPHGKGKFTTTNSEGIEWTYEGEFKNGHFDGDGKTTWRDGEEIGTYKDDYIVPLKGDEIKTLYTSTESFKNHYVELVGKVFSIERSDSGVVALQMFQDFENSDNNTIVYLTDEKSEIEKNDFIRVIGKVDDVFVGTNAYGAELSAPTIIASEYSILTYIDAAAPTLKTVEVNKTQTQYGYSVTLQKIEFSEKETRLYIKIDNNGSDKFSVYEYNIIVSQNGKQYEYQYNYDADYPEIQSGLLVGNSSEGIIPFPKLSQDSLTITIEGDSYNYREDLKPFTFKVDIS